MREKLMEKERGKEEDLCASCDSTVLNIQNFFDSLSSLSFPTVTMRPTFPQSQILPFHSFPHPSSFLQSSTLLLPICIHSIFLLASIPSSHLHPFTSKLESPPSTRSKHFSLQSLFFSTFSLGQKIQIIPFSLGQKIKSFLKKKNPTSLSIRRKYRESIKKVLPLSGCPIK